MNETTDIDKRCEYCPRIPTKEIAVDGTTFRYCDYHMEPAMFILELNYLPAEYTITELETAK